MQLRALYSLLGALPLALSACGDNVAVTSASGTGTTDSDTDDTSTSTSEGVTDTTDDETTAGPTTTTTSTTVGTSTSDPTTDGTTSETTHGENQDPIAVDDDSYVTKSGKNLLVPAGTGLLQNDTLATAYAERGQRYVVDNVDQQLSLDRYVALYQELAAAAQRR